MNLLITNAVLLDGDRPVSVWCEDDRVSGVTDDPSGVPDAQFERTIDLEGRLLLPAFVNPHLHPDKSLLGDKLPRAGGSLEEAVEFTWKFKEEGTVEEIAERSGRAVLECLAAGSTTVRAFADVDKVGGLKPVEGLIRMRDRMRELGLVDVQVVAFPQEGLFRPKGDTGLMREAMEMGADIVGGLPWYEWSDADVRRHVDFLYELAAEYDRDIHVLADDTDDPESRSLEYYAHQAIAHGWEGRISASHCGALAAYDNTHAERVIEICRAADVSISSNPHISLVFGGRHDRGLIRRGATRITELLDGGVNVCSGQDDIDDPYYPLGRGDQLEVAWIVAHVARLTTPEGLRTCIDMVTRNAARALNLEGYGVEVGCRADLVVLDGTHLREALRLQRPRPYVIKDGRVVVEHRLEREMASDQVAEPIR